MRSILLNSAAAILNIWVLYLVGFYIRGLFVFFSGSYFIFVSLRVTPKDQLKSMRNVPVFYPFGWPGG